MEYVCHSLSRASDNVDAMTPATEIALRDLSTLRWHVIIRLYLRSITFHLVFSVGTIDRGCFLDSFPHTYISGTLNAHCSSSGRSR